MPDTQKLIDIVVYGSFLAIFVWTVKNYIVERTKRRPAKESVLTMGEFEEHCTKMQAACLVHVKLVSIEKRLETGDKTLEKHTEAIGKLNIENLSALISGSMEINKRVISMLDSQKFDKAKIEQDILDLQNRTDFLKANRVQV